MLVRDALRTAHRAHSEARLFPQRFQALITGGFPHLRERCDVRRGGFTPDAQYKGNVKDLQNFHQSFMHVQNAIVAYYIGTMKNRFETEAGNLLAPLTQVGE